MKELIGGLTNVLHCLSKKTFSFKLQMKSQNSHHWKIARNKKVIQRRALLLTEAPFKDDENSQAFTLKTSQVAEKGSTANPTKRSATAKLTDREAEKKSIGINRRESFMRCRLVPMKKFVTLLSLCEQKTAAITRQLPTITRILMNPRMASEMRFLGSVHATDSISCVHCVSFISQVYDSWTSVANYFV